MIKYCKFYIEGKCKHNDTCKFIHEDNICREHFFRICKFGDKCKFNHIENNNKQKAGSSIYKNTSEIGSSLAKGTAEGVGMAALGVAWTPFAAIADVGTGIYHGTNAVASSITPKQKTHTELEAAETKKAHIANQKCAHVYRNYLACKVCNKHCTEPKDIKIDECRHSKISKDGAKILKHIQDTNAKDKPHFCANIDGYYPGGDADFITKQALQAY